MPIAIREKVYKDKIMRDAEKEKQKPQTGKAKNEMYKAMGGNVAGYYNKGGKVSGCGPARNKP